MPVLNFGEPDLGYASIFMRQEWISLHVAALKTYHVIVFSGRFTDLPLRGDDELEGDRVTYIEGDPFIIELPGENFLQEKSI